MNMKGVYPINHVCNRAIAEIIEIQKPLNALHGLHLLFYGRYYNDHTGYLFYTNKPFFSIRTSLKVPFPGTYMKENIHPWKELHADSFIRIAEDFNIFDAINFVQQTENGQEVFTYAFSRRDNPGVAFYLTNLELIKKFNDFFKIRAASLIEEADRNKITIPDHLIGKEKNRQPTYQDEVKFLLTNFSIPDDLNQENNLLHTLTEKEFICLCYYLTGKTAAEIAKILNISSKTVAAHLYNLRTKLSCKNRSELFEKAWLYGLISSDIIHK
ncbi:LuxR C-terminal-related transcriptional regulator [Candidatus Berkiella cookevillensis]|uniref:HTH-type quorum sensing-dependent transcriptional regulator VjbR n=1 Tax=Candidatus Berkiella cookevillensis TaxID=437022 RepID=A0A0Q9YHX4_9GAMM|nr:LuxR C-terminal-related transcriptional regulator [Candidatus Berkiella cookevillensis]MCS5708855.1 LuxR C-terminal-related transcriptional regulator [Candidatus Berkiella cookevillensis]